MINRILVVCIGNICRSPMAEAMLKQALPRHDISSAGLGALVGQPADPHAVALMRQQGIDITAHRARQLESWMLGAADLVLVMDTEQKRHLEQKHPLCRGKVYRLGEAEGTDIEDPYQQGAAAFAAAAMLATRGVDAWVDRIRLMGSATQQLNNVRNNY